MTGSIGLALAALSVTVPLRTINPGTGFVSLYFRVTGGPITRVYIVSDDLPRWQHSETITPGENVCFLGRTPDDTTCWLDIFPPVPIASSWEAQSKGSPVTMSINGGEAPHEAKLYCTTATGATIPAGCPCHIIPVDPELVNPPACVP